MKTSTFILSQSQVIISVTFWLGTEHCSNRRRNLISEESSQRFARHTYKKLAPVK